MMKKKKFNHFQIFSVFFSGGYKMIYAVIFHNQMIGVYTCMPDAVMVAKQLHGSVIQSCRLNTETEIGAKLLHP